jgi:hypothetical protein
MTRSVIATPAPLVGMGLTLASPLARNAPEAGVRMTMMLIKLIEISSNESLATRFENRFSDNEPASFNHIS